MRLAVYAMMRWWLDRGMDGFRMDVIDMISKDTSLPDTQPRPGSRYGHGGRYFICGPRNHEFLQEMYTEVFAGRDAHVLTVGEMPGVTIPEAVLFTEPGDASSTWCSSSSTWSWTMARTATTCARCGWPS